MNCQTFDRVEFGCAGGQRQQRDVGGYDEVVGDMPACPVEHQHGVGAGRDAAADLDEVQVHRLAVAAG